MAQTTRLTPKPTFPSRVFVEKAPLVLESHPDAFSACGFRTAVEEVDLSSQHVGEARSALVDVVVTTAAAEQFGPWCSASDFEGGRDRRNGVCLRDNEQKGQTNGGSASPWSTPGEAEQRPRGHPVVPSSPIFGVMSFSPNGPSGVAPMDRSPGIP